MTITVQLLMVNRLTILFMGKKANFFIAGYDYNRILPILRAGCAIYFPIDFQSFFGKS